MLIQRRLRLRLLLLTENSKAPSILWEFLHFCQGQVTELWPRASTSSDLNKRANVQPITTGDSGLWRGCTRERGAVRARHALCGDAPPLGSSTILKKSILL